MDQANVDYFADYLFTAQRTKQEVKKITEKIEDSISIPEAYQIQKQVIKKILATGTEVLGPKMGLTSQAKMQQMQVEQPIYGYTFTEGLIPAGGTLQLADYIHPKVEPEIAFVLAEPLGGSEISPAEVLAKTAYIVPAMEIIDSRYERFEFTLPDVIADNTSAAGVVLGANPIDVAGLDLETMGVVLQINGKIQTVGAGAAVLENPVQAIISLAELLAAEGQVIPANQPILTGGITSAVSLAAGDYVEVLFHRDLGTVSLFVEG